VAAINLTPGNNTHAYTITVTLPTPDWTPLGCINVEILMDIMFKCAISQILLTKSIIITTNLLAQYY